MTTPFEDTLEEVILYSGGTLVALDVLKFLMGFLGHQEDKVKALNRGLAQSLMGHYDKAKGDRALDETRVVIVDMLTSLAALGRGRTLLLGQAIGKTRLLAILKDPSPDVRAAACRLFSTFSIFPDVAEEMLKDRVVILALVKHLLQEECAVAKETLPGLVQLTQKDSSTDKATMQRLLSLLASHTDLARDLLQTLWNVCNKNPEKELAIACGIIAALCPLLQAKDAQIQRLSNGTLAAISVAEAGKTGLIEQRGATDTLCKLVLSTETHQDVRMNAILTICNICEHPFGLAICGKALMGQPKVMAEIITKDQIAEVVDMYMDDEQGRLHALLCLRALVEGDALGVKASSSVLELVPRLYSIATSTQVPAIKNTASKCLDIVCAADSTAKARFDQLPKTAEQESARGKPLLDPARTAILLVQFQMDFFRDKQENHKLLFNTVNFIDRARELGVMIVHATKQGTIPEELSPAGGAGANEIIVSKENDTSAFANPDLMQALKNKDVLLVCGCTGALAVESTMRNAYEKNFQVHAIVNCIAWPTEQDQALLSRLHSTTENQFSSEPLEYEAALSRLPSS